MSLGFRRIHVKAMTTLAALVGLSSLVGCGAPAVRRFPLNAPVVWKDTDQRPFHTPCRPDPEDPQHRICTPEEYISPFAWDAADNAVFRPISRFFAADPGDESVNVNSMDEVPDSSWFTNRIGSRPMTAADVMNGPCGDKVLRPEVITTPWVIDQGKPNGANPGFRVRVEGVGKFMLKADIESEPERATGATSIAARLYHAAGWWVPCDSVVYFDPAILQLKPGLEYTDNSGVPRKFDQKALDELLSRAARRGNLVRMVASRWLPGRAIGPFRYEGVREDDRNDIIPHEDRRDLRGARLIAAWLNHFDSREQNSMSTWMAQDESDPDSTPGHIRHWYIDLGDCFGSQWEWEWITRRLGHAYYLDFGYVFEDFVTAGFIERPWDRAQRSREAPIFGYFSARDFDAEDWRGGYPNPAFARMTEADGAWAARILSRFKPEHIRSAVDAGKFTNPRHSAYLTRTLVERQKSLVRRYFSRLSPITGLQPTADARLCGKDLARSSEAFRATSFRYTAKAYVGAELTEVAAPRVDHSADGQVCVTLPRFDAGAAAPDALQRYLIVDIHNGQALGPLRAHLYNLGEKGFHLAGVERPEAAEPPQF
jgi:hypothetical protein